VNKLRCLFLLLVVAALLSGGYWFLRDLSPPQVQVVPGEGFVSARKPVTITVSDGGTGLCTLRVVAVQGGQANELFSRDYPAGTATVTESVSLGKGLTEGDLELQVYAIDHASIRFGKGNAVALSARFAVDNQPPQISLLTAQHNLNQGGVGVVVYNLSEEAVTTGVKVGNQLFPAFRQKSGSYVGLFAFPWNMEAAAFAPKVVAIDRAGNERSTGFYFHLKPVKFPSDKINITPQFLASKIVPDFQQFFPEIDDPLELFLKVNRDLRKENIAKVLEIGQKSAPAPLWSGVFLRQPNAAVPGYFAQPRTYFHNGLIIDHQTHLGIDLASTARAPVPAANAGSVVYAADLGIYGQCVIIDHGLGLQSLYGHLSQIDVKVGDTVSKGQIIGKTGITGMAGGDHLHFDVLVSGQQVNPIEWWDPSWIKNNVTDKFVLAGITLP